MEEIKTPQVLDAALIAGAQKVEHYEIAAYGSTRGARSSRSAPPNSSGS
jgi:ferritin-like metal-binding protein YciE